MRPFNLAEARIAERLYCQQHVNRRLRMIALLVGLTVLIGAGCYACRTMMAGKETESTSRLADVKGRCAAIKKEMGVVKARSAQRKWQKQLANGSAVWLDVLDRALSSLPESVWMKRIESSAKDSSITMEGAAASFDALSVFIARLKDSGAFADVQLGSAKISGAKGVSYIEFTLPAKLKVAAPVDQAVQSAGNVPEVQQSP